MTEFQPSPELNKGWKALEEKSYESALTEALNYINSKNEKLKSEANKLAGLTYFHLKKPAEALPYFQTAAENSKNVNDWFNIVTAATLSKELELAQKALDKISKLNEKATEQPSVSTPQAKFYFAHALCDVEEFPLAFEQLEWLRGIYETLKITDDTFVYIRGVPFLGHTMELADRIFIGLKNFDKQTWIINFSKKLDEDGQKYLESLLNK